MRKRKIQNKRPSSYLGQNSTSRVRTHQAMRIYKNYINAPSAGRHCIIIIKYITNREIITSIPRSWREHRLLQRDFPSRAFCLEMPSGSESPQEKFQIRHASYFIPMRAFIYTRGKDGRWSHGWSSLNHFAIVPRCRLRGCSDRERADRALGQVSTWQVRLCNGNSALGIRGSGGETKRVPFIRPRTLARAARRHEWRFGESSGCE